MLAFGCGMRGEIAADHAAVVADASGTDARGVEQEARRLDSTRGDHEAINLDTERAPAGQRHHRRRHRARAVVLPQFHHRRVQHNAQAPAPLRRGPQVFAGMERLRRPLE
jgi:hypothetical protein